MQIDENIVKAHRQLAQFSCIPMSIEFVLKLLKLVPSDYFELQEKWNNFSGGTFACFDGQTLYGLSFKHQFSVDGGRNFCKQKMEKLFNTIDQELDEGRYVIISLAEDGGWHNYIIYDRAPNAEYLAVSKKCDGTRKYDDVKRRVSEMTGTDILTYRVS
jgi:hypothetical protein